MGSRMDSWLIYIERLGLLYKCRYRVQVLQYNFGRHEAMAEFKLISNTDSEVT